MRDLSTQELGFVYGAGCSPTPPSRAPKSGKGSKGKTSMKYDKGTGSRSHAGGKGKTSGSSCGC